MSSRRLGIERRPVAGPFKPEFLVAEAVANASSLSEMASLLSEYAKVLDGLVADGWELDDHRGEGDSLYLVDEGGFGTRASWTLELDKTAAWLRKERVEREQERRRWAEEAAEAADAALPGERVSELLAASPAVAWHPDKNGDLDPQTLSVHSRKVAWWVNAECGHVYEWEVRQQCNRLEFRSSGYANFKSSVCRVCIGEAERVEQERRDRAAWFKTAPLVDFWPDVAERWHFERNDTRPEDHIAASATPVWWIHPTCGHPYEEPVRRYHPNRECQVCRDKQVLPGFNDLLTRHPARATIVTAKANPGRALDEFPAWGATKVGWECETCGKTREDDAVRLTKTPLPVCRSCTHVGTSAVEIAIRDALAARVKVEAGEVTLPVAWGSSKRSRVDISGVTDAGVRFVAEYDGERWHTVKTEQDLRKTEALLDAGYVVVRVRENNLPHLPLIHPALAQVTHRWGADVDALADALVATLCRLKPSAAVSAA